MSNLLLDAEEALPTGHELDRRAIATYWGKIDAQRQRAERGLAAVRKQTEDRKGEPDADDQFYQAKVHLTDAQIEARAAYRRVLERWLAGCGGPSSGP